MVMTMLSSDSFYIDPIIFTVCPDKSNVNDPEAILNCNHQPVMIALDIEDYPVIGDDTGRCIASYDVTRIFPVSLFSIMEPGSKRLFCVRMTLPEIPQGSECNDARKVFRSQ